MCPPTRLAAALSLGLSLPLLADGFDPQAFGRLSLNPFAQEKVRSLLQEMKKFRDAEKKHRDRLLGRFDLLIDAIRMEMKNKTVTDLRVTKLEILDRERKEFADSGELPWSDEMLGAVWDYEVALRASRAPVAKQFESLKAWCLEQKQDELLESLHNSLQVDWGWTYPFSPGLSTTARLRF